MLDKIGMGIILGFLSVLLCFVFKRNLLKRFGWVKQFAVGSSIYLIFSSLYFSISGEFFWKDDINFYRFAIALGAIVYIGVIFDNYNINPFKKKKRKLDQTISD
jgi:hypothetical protein